MWDTHIHLGATKRGRLNLPSNSSRILRLSPSMSEEERENSQSRYALCTVRSDTFQIWQMYDDPYSVKISINVCLLPVVDCKNCDYYAIQRHLLPHTLYSIHWWNYYELRGCGWKMPWAVTRWYPGICIVWTKKLNWILLQDGRCTNRNSTSGLPNTTWEVIIIQTSQYNCQDCKTWNSSSQ